MDKKNQSEMNQTDLEKRENRRKRRIKNQVLSYIALFLFIGGVVGGTFFGVKKLTTQKQQVATEEAESSQTMIDEILASEEEIEPLPSEEPSEEVIEELTIEQKLDEIVNAGIEVMPLEDKVAGLFIVTPESITGVSTAVKAGDGTKKALEKYAIGGIIYFDKNIRSESQFKEMVENTKLYTKDPIFVAVDEEGGKVSRIANKGIGTKVPAALEIGQTKEVLKAVEAGEMIGSNLSEVGINLAVAPVADIAYTENSVLGDRSFGGDPQLVAEMAMAMAQGIQSKGVTTCMKHFPGLGGNEKDPHNGISNSERTQEQFRSEDFVPFVKGIEEGVSMIMISNMTASGLTGNNEPCVFSKELITDILMH